MKLYLSLLFFSLLYIQLLGQSNTQIFDFDFEGVTLNGILDIPQNDSIKGIVILVHGSGRTNVIAQNLHGDMRAAINKAGYATYMWDKMGCGNSGGTFNYNQSISNSTEEVIAAIQALKTSYSNMAHSTRSTHGCSGGKIQSSGTWVPRPGVATTSFHFVIFCDPYFLTFA